VRAASDRPALLSRLKEAALADENGEALAKALAAMSAPAMAEAA